MKKNIILASFVLLTASIGYGADAPAWYRRGAVQYEKRLKLTIQNPLAEARTEEPVVLRLDEIQKQAPDFSAGSFTLVDPAAAPASPCHLEEGGNDVPCEAENTEGDGAPDELVFLATLQPKESKIYHLYYTPVGGPATPVYPKRTQITEFKDDPNTLFAIESDVLMFRFGNGDGKPLGLVGDMFGKFKERPAYVQHLYHQVINGLQTDTPAGRWLLYPLNQSGQLGLGNLVAVKGDQVFRPDASAKLSGKILTDGRLRSRGEITITDWVVDDVVLDARIMVTMYAGQPYADYELKVRAKGKADGLRLGVGMQKLDEQQISGGAEQGYAATWGLRKAGMSGESKATWFAYGHAEAEKWGEKEGILDLGLALVFRPEDAAEIQQSDAGGLLLLKGTPSEAQPLKARLVLSGGWKRGGYVGDAQAFFAMQQALSRRLRTPLRVEIAGTESAPAPAARKSLAKATFFLSNPSCADTTLPAEIDLNAFGLEAKEGVVCADKNVSTDMVKIGGQTRVFVQAPVAALKTRSVTLAPGKVSVSPSFKITEEKAEGGVRTAVRVEAGEVTWLVTTNGLAKATWKGKELNLQQPGLTGEVQVVHNGPVVAVVRVGGGETAIDYYFFQGLPAMKVVSGRAIDLQGTGGYSTYMAKKEINGIFYVEFCTWGRVTSDRIPGFKKTDVCYPAEWAALFATNQAGVSHGEAGAAKTGIMAYGDPSTGPMIVDKGGVLHVDAPGIGERSALTLCLIERPEEGEELFARMCRPIVSMAHEKGFLSQAYRDGNNVPDAVFVEDRNGNKMPDFVGDRWSFDMNSDDALESILEFESPPDKPDRAVKMKVYCDTATGQTELHANSFLGRFGVDRPYPEVQDASRVVTNTCFYDGCLSRGETNVPFFVYEDWDGDGLFFKGPVTEGGFVSGGRILAAYGGPAWWDGSWPMKNRLLECWDLDGDGDNDVWWVKIVNPLAGFFSCKAGDQFLHNSYFDLSDHNLEPIAMVDAYRGRAGCAARFPSFVNNDNGKYYCEGYQQEDEYFGGQDWPGASGWDIDNDGVSEGNLYSCQRIRMFSLDLVNEINGDNPFVKNGLFLEEDLLYTYPTRHENFCLFFWEGERGVPDGAFPREYIVRRFPRKTIRDPLGHTMYFHGTGVPDGWRGEARQCREWPDGTYDYVESNNGWDSALLKTSYMGALHWLRPCWRTAHEANWGMIYCRDDARVEINPEGNPSGEYTLYFSPIVNDYHLKGLQFGVQTMTAEDWPKEVRLKYAAAYGKSAQHVQEYANPERLLNDYSRIARKLGALFLYYSDDDGDGYADSYVLDNEHDGTYEKRVWLDKKAGTLAVYDKGQLAVAPNTLKMPEFRFVLKNYAAMVDLYRSTTNAAPLLWTWAIKDGRLAPHDGPSFVLSSDWLPKVALDVAHRKDPADPWKDYEPQGLDTLARIISQQMAEPVVLKEPWSAQSLAGLDVLVAWNLETASADAELAALDAFLKGGGVLLVVAAPDAAEPSAKVMGDLAARFDVKLAKEPAVSVTPSLKAEQLEAMFKEAKDEVPTKLLAGVLHPFFLEGGTLQPGGQGKALLTYAGQPILTETAVGKGKVVVMNSNLLQNKFMCPEFDLRIHPFKPGNQQVAWNLFARLLAPRRLNVVAVSADELQIEGKGGRVSVLSTGAVSLNGKEAAAERQGAMLTVTVPTGNSKIVITPEK